MMNKKWLKFFLFFAIFSFILPITVAAFLLLVAQLSGCNFVGEQASQCLALGLNLGDIIEKLIHFTWQFPLMFPQNFTVIPAYFATTIIVILIHLTLRGRSSIFWSLFCIWYIPIAPSLLGIILVSILANIGNCQVNAAGPNPCSILGVDMGEAFAGAAVIPWLILVCVGINVFISFAYMILYSLVTVLFREQSS
ncbi:MAG: hypothetical protein SWJ54_17720 [Cyanobacteriota bacterium]|nr:hypothetical protein [Cyanobacteriota bacterium]